MTKKEFKCIFQQYAKNMIDKWFDTNSLNDNICKALAYTLINANIDKYDKYLDYVCDANGMIQLNTFMDALIENYMPYQIDLTKYNIPFLPNKILLVGKQDLILLKNMCMQHNYNE